MDFNKLFKKISAEEMNDNIFKLVGEDFAIATAGKENNYNSMVVSGGGFGVLFKKPTTWCIFRSDRYTLEIIKKEHTYTLSYFPNEYKKEILFLGSKSGRNSNKMNEVKLTNIKTPSENITFKEARLIIECKLTQITTPNEDDFYNKEAKDYIEKEYKNPKHNRKFVFGEILNIWIKDKLN